MTNQEIIETIKGQLIVSCQALPEEPLHSSFIMGRMALAAFQGGAKGIRANTIEDIQEIKKMVNLPIIGIIKKVYADEPNVYITPTMVEVDALVEEGVDIIALDATKRMRPNHQSMDDLFQEVRKKYPNQLFMADTSNLQEGLHAAEIGFDFVGTTLAGYTGYTKGISLPPYRFLKDLVEQCPVPIIAEGNISTPEHCRHAMDMGVHAVVVGSAITRPLEITKKFMKALNEE
ncbi:MULTISPECIES: N-acetylmannosamine-6-phosphate 2-epimerase [Terrabacteria group]|uniref:N-acetylmannosamine-6-phosphate 2-epimerase n=1 Tax=Bacillati TaxID=1783272 RepID=UPI001939BF5F|nr:MULTISPECIES: N-acetylmannosamine-6-phosphate 2-epimerase [Terrabacteria group]QRG86598.1 N-acetylmannosamine-6-phosphate 2-epimerase [Bulleidia sp. zg-1006]